VFNRCIYCDSKCPDFSDMCDTCRRIEAECREVSRYLVVDMDDIDNEIDEEVMLEDEDFCS
jgi:hypothetical protein